MSRASRAEVRALHRQMREWRRGRADTTLMEVASDAYIALFATVMLGAMATSAILQTRESVTTGCATAACGDSRFGLGWVGAGAVLALVLATARTVGPLQVSPAAGSWLLSAPVDRAAALRPRLFFVAALTGVFTALVAAVVAGIAGFAGGAVVIFTFAVAAGATGLVLVACIAQSRRGSGIRVVTWALGSLTWIGLVVIAAGRAPSAPTSPLQGGLLGLVGVFLGWLIALALLIRASAALPALHRDRLTPGGSLLSGLSGALASLDLSMMYDILVARRWLEKSSVRPVRGGPSGAWALVWRDVVRIRRSGASVLILAAALVLPYVVVTVDLGEIVVVVGALTAFGAGIPLCSALRTTGRNPGLVRCFPMSAAAVRTACLAVPAALILVWSSAAVPAIHAGLPAITWSDAVLVSVAMGVASITAIARWLMAAPPDYGKALVSSPAGGVPTGLLVSVLRGFDVLVLLTAPVLIAADSNGAIVSLALAGIVLPALLRRK